MRKKIKSLLMSTILLGSLAAGNNPVFASAHDDESWNVAAYNPGNVSAKGTKYFYINNVKTTSSNRYANLKISLTYEDYVTYYGGRVRIVK